MGVLKRLISCYAAKQGVSSLGACPRIENLLWKSWIWSDSPIIFVKYAQYSPQMIEKFDSNLLSLATAPILRQAPSHNNLQDSWQDTADGRVRQSRTQALQ